MFAVVIRSHDGVQDWFVHSDIKNYVIQLEENDISDGEAYPHSTNGIELRLTREMSPLKRCVGVKMPEGYYLDDYIGHNKEKFIRALHTCKNIARKENRDIPIIIKVRCLLPEQRAIIKDIANSLSNQFTLCRQPLVLEPEHITINFRKDLYESMYAITDVAKVYSTYSELHPAYSCFNLADAFANVRILDLLAMNKCGTTSEESPSIFNIMNKYADTCNCALLSFSTGYGLTDKEYMRGFKPANVLWLKRAIMGIRGILTLDDAHIFIEVHDYDDPDRKELRQSIEIVQNILKDIEEQRNDIS